MKNFFFTFLIVFISCITFSKAQTVPDSTYYKRLYYTCKVWGFLKYFHSEVAKGTKDWDNVLFQTLNGVKSDVSNNDFNNTLGNMLNSAGEMAQPTTQLPSVPDSLKYNLNLSWLNDPIFSDEIKARLDTAKNWFRPQDNYYVQAVAGAGNPAFTSDTSFYSDRSINGPSENIRLLALFRYWNIINYFSPDKYLTDQNWDTTLTEFIPILVKVSGNLPFFKAFLRLVAKLNDTHALTSGPSYYDFFGSYFLPLQFKYVENQTVIIDVYAENTGLKVGDIIKDINGVDINTIRDSLKEYMYASNEASLNWDIDFYLAEGPEGNVKLTVENNQGQKDVTVARNLSSSEWASFYYSTGPAWKILNAPDNKKYGYVDMGTLQASQIDSMFNALWNTDAIIFDLRNYPNGTLPGIVSYLFKAPIHMADFTIPDIKYPGTLYWVSPTVGSGDFSKTYDKNIFILVDDNTYSQGEYAAMGLQQDPKAVTIGNQTEGVDGNASLIYLPEGIFSWFTGFGVFYPDHRQTQRIGIVPDVVVYPTIEGIRAGKDEVLEAALNYTPTGINNTAAHAQLSNYNLKQNYPNPFNPSTVISYQLPVRSYVTIKVYDILGREVATLVKGVKNVGNYSITFNGSDLASGIYFYQLKTGNFIQAKKMILLK